MKRGGGIITSGVRVEARGGLDAHYVTVRISQDLARRIKLAAIARGTSIQDLVAQILADQIPDLKVAEGNGKRNEEKVWVLPRRAKGGASAVQLARQLREGRNASN